MLTNSLNTDPMGARRMPYPKWTYPARAVWVLIHATVWKLVGSEIRFLRPALLRMFGAAVPPRVLIRGSVRIHFPWLLDIGTDAAISHNVNIYNLGGVTIGERTVISQDVYLCGGTHDYTRSAYPLVRKRIIIEDDVWIGAGAFIGPGVRIGRGAVIGARAVVFKDIPPWKVAVGNPARVIKDRVMRNM
jgi:putative colanic acid biosynthesis acetyltransferase WcaF